MSDEWKPEWNPLLERAERHAAIIEEIEAAGIDYARKMHRESDCGDEGFHWAECERFTHALAALARNLDLKRA